MLNPQFGSGVLYGIPNAGNFAANPTPMQFGILQEVQLGFKGDLKKLYGMQQLPVAKARGKVDVSGKGKIASLDPMFYSQLFFGQPTATGVQRPIFNEQHAIAATVAPLNAGTGVTSVALSDLGVINQTTGVQLTKVTGTPTAGQYAFTAAVPGTSPASYTFSSADVTSGFPVLLNYSYNDVTRGVTLAINNELMGWAPEFQAVLYNNFRGNLFAIQLNSCVMGELSIPTKQEDYWISDFSFDASADAAGVLGYIYADQL